MGEIAEMSMVNRVVCSNCGEWMDDIGERRCVACRPAPPVRRLHPDKPLPRRPVNPNEFFVTAKNTDAAYKALKFWLLDRAVKTFTANEDANRFYVDLYDESEKGVGRVNCFNANAQKQAMRLVNKRLNKNEKGDRQ